MVADNAKNIQCAIKSNSQWTQINCMTHTLQLAINDAKVGLGIEKLLAKARKIVSHYNQSPKAYDRISKIQFQMGVVQHKLIQMVETRWNSEFYMLRRLVEQQQLVSADISKEGKIENLTTPEWALAGGLVEILEPLEIATRQLSQEASPTISLVIPMLFSIKHSLNNCINKNINGKLFAKRLLRSVETRFTFTKVIDKPVYLFSMLLDPRFKNLPLEDYEKEGVTKGMLKELNNRWPHTEQVGENVQERNNNPDIPEVTAKTSKLWGAWDDVTKTVSQSNPGRSVHEKKIEKR